MDRQPHASQRRWDLERLLGKKVAEVIEKRWPGGLQMLQHRNLMFDVKGDENSHKTPGKEKRDWWRSVTGKQAYEK
jgi:hypothetical protein